MSDNSSDPARIERDLDQTRSRLENHLCRIAIARKKTVSEPEDSFGQLAGALSAISVAVAEICKTLPTTSQAKIRQQLERLQQSAADGSGSFAVSVRETCDRLLLEL